MAKALIKYQAADGCLFDDQESAERRDKLCARLRELEDFLGPRVNGANLRRKHSPQTLRTFRERLVNICRELFPTEAVFKHDAQEIHPMSFAGRFIDDAGPRVLGMTWQRLACIDADGFEYEQPFFALNPDKWAGSEAR